MQTHVMKWHSTYTLIFEGCTVDEGICEIIGIHLLDYKKFMVELFNAEDIAEDVIFMTREDAQAALDWISGVYTANKLAGEVI